MNWKQRDRLVGEMLRMDMADVPAGDVIEALVEARARSRCLGWYERVRRLREAFSDRDAPHADLVAEARRVLGLVKDD